MLGKGHLKPIPNQYINFAKNSYPYLKHLSLADYNDDRDLSVDILIRSDNYGDILENEVVRSESGTVAIKSKVCCILSGSFCNSAIPNSTAFVCHTLKCSSDIVTDTLDRTVEKFWVIEKIGTKENQSVYQHFCEETSFDENENR